MLFQQKCMQRCYDWTHNSLRVLKKTLRGCFFPDSSSLAWLGSEWTISEVYDYSAYCPSLALSLSRLSGGAKLSLSMGAGCGMWR